MRHTILSNALLSLSLLTINLSATATAPIDCPNCVVDLSKLSSLKKVEKKSTLIVQNSVEEENATEIETIILPHSKYVMTASEIEEYELNELLSKPIMDTDERLINQSLPQSEYVCDNEKKVTYDELYNIVECI